ncbi:MAG TPA: tetratricopeptide repeat protein, partial [Planctomycetota bacterium]|nr:tetratricopeptide repeat protein [Planctomycetota bacterium]
FERTVGEEHPNSAQALGNLAVVFNTSGRYDRAEVYAVRAVGAAERMFPAESVQLVPSLITLSNVRRNQQRGTEARGLVERAAAICEKANHPCRLQVLSNLAIIIADGQDHARAVPLLERVLALKETQYGADHPSVADTLNGLSRSRIELGDLARARADAERAAAIWHKAGQPKEREALWHLGQIALAEHKLAEALRHHEQGLAMYDDDPHNPYRVAALRGVGEVQLAMRQTAAAVATLEQAVRLAEEKSGEIPPFEPSYSRFLLGRALWATGDRARAATLAKAGLATLPEGYPDVRDEMNRWIAQLPGR